MATDVSRVDFRCYLITDRRRTGGRPLVAAVQAAAAAGIRAVQLREKDLPPRGVYALAQEVQSVLAPLSARLLINDRADIACALPADGVHLPATGLSACAAHRCLPPSALIGVSAHTVAEARFAQECRADFITASPIFDTPSKAAYGAPIGLDGLREICAAVTLPVFALGGITPARIPACRDAGAHGVAAIAALLDVPSIADAVAAFREALGTL